MISMTSSGSSCSAMAVEPTMSQNRMVTTRRSPAICPPEARNRSASSFGTMRWRRCSARSGWGSGVSGAPHLGQ